MCNQFESNKTVIFAKRFEKLLENRGDISMDKLAEELRTTKPTLYRWKNGEVYPQAVNLAAICEYFHVPRNYFDCDPDEKILVDEKYHEEQDSYLHHLAKINGLNTHFVQFLKDTPALADAVISASYVNYSENTYNSNVPETDSPFQFVSSSGIKIYLPEDMMDLLAIIQTDIEEYAQFIINKRLKAYEKAIQFNPNDAPEVVKQVVSKFEESEQKYIFLSLASAAKSIWHSYKQIGQDADYPDILENLCKKVFDELRGKKKKDGLVIVIGDYGEVSFQTNPNVKGIKIRSTWGNG